MDEKLLKRKLDGLLSEIGAKKQAIGAMQRTMEAELKRVADGFAPFIRTAEEDLAAVEAELVGLMKFHKADLFAGRDRVDLPCGALLRAVERRVRRVKGMLARLKQAGLSGLIKVAESPDWDEIEKLSDPELASLGTRRVPREVFAYEVGESPRQATPGKAGK